MSILKINGLSHMYDNKVLFKDADLTINNGEHVGIVGLTALQKHFYKHHRAQRHSGLGRGNLA